ncbi:hypothetical protein [Xanthomonas sacchari]|uniref:hypothetical protein n=1 Tax=Xanthomonas sacchari TaxID=56458 RepID=UPI00224DC563|nr:hypothetical protein [Xanthomonas sacchari]MCW0370234.1 hypothetical protein [Xanthomonas sacchari]
MMTPTITPEALNYTPGELDRAAPARIWLQINTEGDNSEREESWPGHEHVTWQDEPIGGLEIQYVRADLALQAAPAAAGVPGHLDVRRILLEVVPGWDGMGHEIYAKSVEDVEREFSRMSGRIRELERTQLLAQPQAEQQGADALVDSLVQVMNAKYDGLGRLPPDVLEVLNMAVEAIAASQPVGEPVEWQVRGPRTTQWQTCDRELHESAHKADGVETRALYTAPPAAVDSWQPIKTAPKDGTVVLGLLEGSDIPQSIRFREGWVIAWDDYRIPAHDGPTHWLPLIDSKAVRS